MFMRMTHLVNYSTIKCMQRVFTTNFRMWFKVFVSDKQDFLWVFGNLKIDVCPAMAFCII